MTECNRSPMLFSSLGKRKVVADFAGGTITSDGGVLLLRQIEQRRRLIERMDAAKPAAAKPVTAKGDEAGVTPEASAASGAPAAGEAEPPATAQNTPEIPTWRHL